MAATDAALDILRNFFLPVPESNVRRLIPCENTTGESPENSQRAGVLMTANKTLLSTADGRVLPSAGATQRTECSWKNNVSVRSSADII